MTTQQVRHWRAAGACVRAVTIVTVLIGALLFSALLGLGQETRGTIFGRVLDPSSAVVAGAKVTILNTETNISTSLVSNSTGYYEASLLLSGSYRVTVEMQGFKTSVRDGIVLPVGSRLQADMRLEVGEIAQQVTVTAEAPLLETSTGASTRIVDERSIQDLPVPGGNSVTLAKLVAGVQSVDSLSDKTVRLHSNGAGSRYTVGGNVGGNEYSVDGTPDGGNGRNIAYMPAPELIQEFKVETGNFDASMGHSTGVNVAMMTKSGTNDWHGQLRETHHQSRWEAMPFFTKRAYLQQIAQAEAAGNQALANQLRSQPGMPSGRQNQYSAVIGGPVILPKIISGKNKLFFFFGYTGFRVSEARTSYETLPTAAMRDGDFSQLLQIVNPTTGAPQGANYQIYDPLTVKPDPARSGHYIRQPFTGNIVPKSRIINPTYGFYNKMLPLPNVNQAATVEPNQNHITYASPYEEKYYAYANRIDYHMSERNRFFARWSLNNWQNYNPTWLSTSPYSDRFQTGDSRRNFGVMVDWVHNLSSSTLLDVSLSNNQYVNTAYVTNPTKPSEVGLPSYLDAKAGDSRVVPSLIIGGFTQYSNGAPAYDKYRGFAGKADLFHIHGAHTIRTGFEARGQFRNQFTPDRSAGIFSYGNSYTKHYDDNYQLSQSNMGLAWAAFMMGIPDSMVIYSNASFAFSNPFYAAYVQEGWRVNNRLTLNAGLRMEYELGLRERYDRAISTFDSKATLPITAAAQTAYAAKPIPELPASQFIVAGGSVYASQSSGHRVYKNNLAWLPKVSAAFLLTSKTVLSGGYGISVDTLGALAVGAPDSTGFSRTTTVNSSTDYGMTWVTGNPGGGISPMADPFPLRADGNRFDQPVKDSFGLMAKVGRGSWNATPYDREHARQQRWRVGVQHELGNSLVVSVAYVGTYSDKIGINQTLSYLPEQYWASGLVRNDAIASNLNANVTNPFYINNFADLKTSNAVLYQDMAANSFFSSSNIQKNKLLRAYPQMNGIVLNLPIGEVKTHELNLSVERRFSKGLGFNVAYTRLYAQESFLLNEFDATTSWRESNNGRPHRLTSTAIYQLPFGKGRRFASSGILNHVLGGFQASILFELQPGPLIDWGNLFYYGDLSNIKLDNPTPDKWFNTANFETNSSKTPAAYHRRVFPTRIDGVRADYIHNWNGSLLRDFRIRERVGLQLRIDMMNIANRSQFDVPETSPTSANFGKVTQQPALTGSGYGACNRWVQVMARLQF